MSDSKSIEAEFVEFDTVAGEVVLKRSGGQVIRLKPEILSEADQQWLEEKKKEAVTRASKVEKAERQEFEVEGVRHGKVTVRYPAGLPEEARQDAPICFIFSPGGNPTSIQKKMESGADLMGWITVGVYAYSNDRSQKDMKLLEKETGIVIKNVQKKVPHDKDKLILSGMSGGGWWCYRTSALVHQKTAAIIAFGGWMSKDYQLDYPRRMTVAIVNGDQDKNANLYIEPDSEFLRKKKKAITKSFNFPGGHAVAPPEVCSDVIKWVHESAQFGG